MSRGQSASGKAGAALLALLGAGGGLLSGHHPAHAQDTTAPATTAPAPARFAYRGALEQGGWIRGTAPPGTLSAWLGAQALELDAQGRFFAAFDRDAEAETELVAHLRDGRSVRQSLAIAPRAWPIERVDTPMRPPGATSEEFRLLRAREQEAIQQARTAKAAAGGWNEDFIWPLIGRISGRFGAQRIYRGEPGAYHSGIDIATGASGDPFVAPAGGVVTLATREPFSLEGYLLVVDHGQGLNSAFLHLAKIAVVEGQEVAQGQILGRIGATGRATGPHLHWSMKWHEARLDPLLFTGPMP